MASARVSFVRGRLVLHKRKLARATPPARHHRYDLIVAAAVDRATDQFQRHYNRLRPIAVRASAAGCALSHTVTHVEPSFFFSIEDDGPVVRV